MKKITEEGIETKRSCAGHSVGKANADPKWMRNLDWRQK
jgi:hypothetical protein